MSVSAILLGSIGVIAETSDMQRRAYNTALAEAGLGWEWDRETYAELLTITGGQDRLAMLARATGTPLSDAQITAIHARKTELACAEVRERGELRPGIAELAALARTRGIALGFVTSTYAPNVDAILDAAGDRLPRSALSVIVTRDDVANGKPAPDPYLFALERLGLSADRAIAIEDTAASLASARRAGLRTIVTPGAFTADQDFHGADVVAPALTTVSGTLDPRILALIETGAPAELHAAH